MAKKVQRKGKETRQRASQNIDWRPAFLASFAETGVIVSAARAAKVSPLTVWKAKRGEPEFAAAFEDARAVGAMLLEQEAVRRARDGVQRLKFYEGRVILIPDPAHPWPMIPDPDNEGKTIPDPYHRPPMIPYVEHEYSDTLLTLLLKRHFPAEFRESVKVEHAGEVTNKIVRVPVKEPPR